VGVFGGPNLTPPGSSRFQVVEGAVLGSLIATGPSRRRWGAHPPVTAREPHFTLCNLAVRASSMRPFPSGFYSGEECALLNGLVRDGVTMRHDERLAVYHERRPTFRGFAHQVFCYGLGRGRAVRRSPYNAVPMMVGPPLLIAYLLAAATLATTNALALLPAAAYAAAVIAQAIKINTRVRWKWTLPLAAALIVTVHVCYAFGLLAGLASGRRRRRATGSVPVATVLER
jgi:hypothetical protein